MFFKPNVLQRTLLWLVKQHFAIPFNLDTSKQWEQVFLGTLSDT